MAKVVFEAIEVHPETLFDGDGVVRRWMVELTSELKTAVQLKAPPNRSRAKYRRPSTGALVRSIKGSTARSGPLQDVSVVSVGTAHAKYVLGGTAAQGVGYIYSTRGFANKALVDRVARRKGGRGKPDEDLHGMFMKLPLNGLGRRLHLRVHGQRANNFLFDGYNEVARAHRALGHMHNPFAF